MNLRASLREARSSAVSWAFDRAMVRALCERMTRNCPRILMYHRFSAQPADRKMPVAEFEQQMAFLREQNYNVMSLPRFVEAMQAGEDAPRVVVVTVDDGYEDFYEHALPVLRQYQIPATIFVTNEFIDQTIWLWPDVVEFALKSTSHSHVQRERDGRELRLQLGSPVAVRKAWSEIGDHLLSMIDTERRAAIDEICRQLEVDVPTQPPAEFRAMNWQQVRECQQAGVEIGAHTLTHPVLTSLSERDAEVEIAGSKSDLEARLGVPCRSFAYPNGTSFDYNSAIKDMVRRAGFSNATVAFHDGARRLDLYELRRISARTSFERFRRALCGAEQLTLDIKNRFNGH